MSNRMKSKFIEKKPWSFMMIIMTLLTLADCSNKTSYSVTSSTEAMTAPGSFQVSLKVDILLVEDNTGSIYEPFSAIDAGVKGLLATLDTQGWDYHLSTVPLTTFRPIQQVVGSIFDGNNGSWQAPYPGA